MDARLTSAPRPNRLVALFIGLPVLLLLAACGSTAAPTGSTPATPLGGTPTVQPGAVGTTSPNVTPVLTPAATTTPAATATSPEGSIPDPCVLVTKDEAEAAVGTSLDSSSDLFSRAADGTTGRTCYFDAPTGPGGLTFNIWKTTPDQFAQYKQDQMQLGDVHDIAGLGDAAYRVGWIGLVVLKDDYALEFGIEMVDYDPDTAQANLKTLATTAISRL